MTCKEYDLWLEGPPLSDVLTGIISDNLYTSQIQLNLFETSPVRHFTSSCLYNTDEQDLN